MDDERQYFSSRTTNARTACALTDRRGHPANDVDDKLGEDDLGLAGTSDAIRELRTRIRRIARFRASVLVTGETGVGKELVARAIHRCGQNPRAPFVTVNAATLRGSLFQSQCFGHERGAFTGAVDRRRGLFELADGGTLLLDEIGDLDLGSQAELLRVLETGEIRPLGAERVRRVKVRVVAATNRSLPAMVAAGTFRADLLYRLNTVTIAVPPLRQRIEDIPDLARVVLARIASDAGTRSITSEALLRLVDQPWPGNVRELRNVLERAAMLSDAPVLDDAEIRDALRDDTSTGVQAHATGATLERTTSPTDDAIRTALALSGGSINGAAKMLGIARTTLRDRLARSIRKPD